MSTQYLRTSPSILSTDFIGAVEEDGVFSFAYRFETNQGNFIACRVSPKMPTAYHVRSCVAHTILSWILCSGWRCTRTR